MTKIMFSYIQKRNKMSKKDFPCECGHAKINHSAYVSLIDNFKIFKCSVIRCYCEDFIPDNLKYLEKEYDKRNPTK